MELARGGGHRHMSKAKGFIQISLIRKYGSATLLVAATAGHPKLIKIKIKNH